MYHYIRKEQKNLPFFVYLHADNFEKQIDYFCENYHILSKEEFNECIEQEEVIENGIILTFDDGLSDHYEFVYPILKQRNLWGIFYIPTKPYEKETLLDVHRVHYLLGKYGGKRILEVLSSLITDDDLIETSEELFINATYLKQDNDFDTTKVKRIVNYYMKPDRKSNILEKLMNIFFEDEQELFSKYYLNIKQINEMIDTGMSIACHGHSHTLFSNLDYTDQENDINNSITIIQKLTNNRMYNSFCYPYGGKQSYNDDTLRILSKNNFRSAISVESRKIKKEDLTIKYELPRYDCNEFYFGKATKGIK